MWPPVTSEGGILLREEDILGIHECSWSIIKEKYPSRGRSNATVSGDVSGDKNVHKIWA